MAKMAASPERISEEYTNIWGPPLTTEGGMQTMKTSKTAQVNFIRTIKPQPQKLFQDLEVCQMTFGIGGEVKIHVNYEDKAQVFSYKFAKKYFPAKLAHYVLANQLELLNGLEWVGRYKSPDLDNIRAREKRISLLRNNLRMTVQERLTCNMYMVQRQSKKGISLKSRINLHTYNSVHDRGEITLNGNPITRDELEDYLTHYQDNHHDAERKQEVALLDSACDTCAIGGTAWVIQEHTGRNVDVTGHTLHKTSRTNIPIVSAITACDIPSGKTILLKLNETMKPQI